MLPGLHQTHSFCYLMWEALSAGEISRERRAQGALISEKSGPELLGAGNPSSRSCGCSANYSSRLPCQCSLVGKGGAVGLWASQGFAISFLNVASKLKEAFQGCRGLWDEMVDTALEKAGFLLLSHAVFILQLKFYIPCSSFTIYTDYYMLIVSPIINIIIMSLICSVAFGI